MQASSFIWKWEIYTICFSHPTFYNLQPLRDGKNIVDCSLVGAYSGQWSWRSWRGRGSPPSGRRWGGRWGWRGPRYQCSPWPGAARRLSHWSSHPQTPSLQPSSPLSWALPAGPCRSESRVLVFAVRREGGEAGVIYSSPGSINQRGARCRVTELLSSTDPVLLENDCKNTCNPLYLTPSLGQVNTVTQYRLCHTSTTNNWSSVVIRIVFVDSNFSNSWSSSLSQSLSNALWQHFHFHFIYRVSNL